VAPLCSCQKGSLTTILQALGVFVVSVSAATATVRLLPVRMVSSADLRVAVSGVSCLKPEVKRSPDCPPCCHAEKPLVWLLALALEWAWLARGCGCGPLVVKAPLQRQCHQQHRHPVSGWQALVNY